MPLLRQAEFVRRKTPKNLSDAVPLYFLALTSEVFTDYEEFCYRIIQCNSTVWTCSITGRTELTYVEALESEQNAEKLIDCFPSALKVPVLYLTSHAQKQSFPDLITDIFDYVECHYFINEIVRYKSAGKWIKGKILSVQMPDACDTKSKTKSLKKLQPDWTPPGMFLYTINTNLTGESAHTSQVYGNILQRPEDSKCPKDSLSAFLKYVTQCNAQGQWVIKDSLLSKYKINDVKFEDFFVGEPPEFCCSRNKNVEDTMEKKEHQSTGKHTKQCVSKVHNDRKGCDKPIKRKSSNIDHCTEDDRIKKSKANESSRRTKQVQQNIQKYLLPSRKLSDVSCRSDEPSTPEVTIKEEPVSDESELSIQELLICSEEEESDSYNDEIKVVWSSTIRPNRSLKHMDYFIPPAQSLTLTPQSQKLLESMPVCIVNLGSGLPQRPDGVLVVPENGIPTVPRPSNPVVPKYGIPFVPKQEPISDDEDSKEREVIQPPQSDKNLPIVTVKKTSPEDKDKYANKKGALQNNTNPKPRKMRQTQLVQQIPCSSNSVENKVKDHDDKSSGKKNGNSHKRKLKIVGTLKPWVQGNNSEENRTSKKQTVSDILPEQKVKKKNWLQVQREIEAQEKLRKREESLRIKAKQEEEKQRFNKFMKEWRKNREDLLCEDFKPLPIPCDINFQIPNELFGEFVMILEFFNSFKTVLRVKSIFPSGFTFELLERALVEKEITGPLHDTIKLMLSYILNFQVTENEEPKSASRVVDLHLDDLYNAEIITQQAVSHGAMSSDWNHVLQDVPLCDIPLDPVTISEVLRVHLLNSDPLDLKSSWLTEQTDDDIFREDPGQKFSEGKTKILTNLRHFHVSELSIAEKLDILGCLMNQILSSVAIREKLDLRSEEMRRAKTNLRASQILEIKLQKEVTVKRVQEKKEQKLLLAKGSSNDGNPVLSEGDLSLQKQKLEKELNKVKVEIEKKSSKIMPLAMSHQLLPIGSDRAHRNYWLFSFVPGLFVEHNPFEIGTCLPEPTPLAFDLADTITHVRRLFEEEEGQNASDKENDSFDRNDVRESRPVNVSGKKMLGDQNSSPGNLSSVRQEEKLDQTLEMETPEEKLLVCSSSEDCPVHRVVDLKSRWSFFSKQDDITCLLDALNERGIRENALRSVIIREKQRILDGIPQCPAHKLNPLKFQLPETEPKKSTRSVTSYKKKYTNLDFPPDTPVSHIMEWTIREIILELENKLKSGCVGSFEVNDRLAWRNAIKSGKYDRQCSNLSWGFQKHNYVEKQVAQESQKTDSMGTHELIVSCHEVNNTNGTEMGDADHHRHMPYSKKLNYNDSVLKVDIPEEEQNHEELNEDNLPNAMSDTSSSLELNEDNLPNAMSDTSSSLELNDTRCDLVTPRNPVIKDLASAILQLGQSIDHKFLQNPLVDEDSTKTNVRLKCWEDALMKSINFSQLFIHHLILDSSINWSKSALNAPCCICRRRGDAAKMLLCDTCNKGHHIYCLQPKLKSIPLGDWYCPACFQKQAQPIVEDRNLNNLEDMTSSSSEEETRQKLTRERKRKARTVNEDRRNGSVIVQYGDTIRSSREMSRKGIAGTFGENNCGEYIDYVRKYSADKDDEDSQGSGDDMYMECEDSTDEQSSAGSDEELHLTIRKRRGCSSATIAKIASFTKRLRSKSWEDDGSEGLSVGIDPSEPSCSGFNDYSTPSRRSSRYTMHASENLPLDNAVLQNLIYELIHHEDAWPFLRPVRRSEVPDYHLVIKRPIDLGTIKYRLNTAMYRSNREFISDVILIFHNCYMYNKPDTIEFMCGERLRAFLEKRCKELGIKCEIKTFHDFDDDELV